MVLLYPYSLVLCFDFFYEYFFQHGTCPVCRKTLEGKDTSTDETSMDISEQQANSAVEAATQNSQSSSSSSTRLADDEQLD